MYEQYCFYSAERLLDIFRSNIHVLFVYTVSFIYIKDVLTTLNYLSFWLYHFLRNTYKFLEKSVKSLEGNKFTHYLKNGVSENEWLRVAATAHMELDLIITILFRKFMIDGSYILFLQKRTFVQMEPFDYY